LGCITERIKASSILGLGRSKKDLFRSSDVTHHAKCRTQLAGELGSFGTEVDCAREQIHRCRRVSPLPSANPCAAKPLAAGGGEFAHVLVLALKLCQVSVCLLEVVADELVRPVAAIKAFAGELVQLGALRFRDAAIRDVPHEHMVEAEDVLYRTHQTSFDEAREMSIDVVVGREVVKLHACETTADDGGPAHHSELSRIEAVETAGQQRFHGRRCLVERQLRCLLDESK
jgi:hypothetical protein